MKKKVYFDYNATSPLRDNVKKALISAFEDYGNPSSIHSVGRQARQKIETAKKIIADYMGVSLHNVIFTGSATEANHLMLRGNDCDALLIPQDEHDSVLAAAKLSNKKIYPLKLQKNGDLDLDFFDETLSSIVTQGQKPFLTIMKVNNESGHIKNLQHVSQKIRAIGGIIHSDAVQALGKIPFEDWTWQCDAITLAAHKVGGPKGVGCLILKDKIKIDPLLTGGAQEMRRRAGTENIPAIMGFSALVEAIQKSLENMKILSGFKSDIIKMIDEKRPDLHIICRDSAVCNSLLIAGGRLESEKKVILADLSGIAVSAGSACSSGRVKASHVLTAYGYPQDITITALRISMGFLTQNEEVIILKKFIEESL